MKRYGLIGHPVAHSWSQSLFGNIFARHGITDATYLLYDLPCLDGLRQWVAEQQLNGFNVTIPYKQAIIPYLDSLSDEASAIGAVNCVSVHDGILVGHNTDAPAFAASIQPYLDPWNKSALILGTGGAAHAVAYGLRSLGIDSTFVSRNPSCCPGSVSYDQAARLAQSHSIIVNATPVGMHPNVDANPWPWFDMIGRDHICFDLIYNPTETIFLQQADQHQASAVGGLDMLYKQAELSWQIFAR